MACAASVIWVFVTNGVLIYGSKFVLIQKCSKRFFNYLYVKFTGYYDVFISRMHTFINIIEKSITIQTINNYTDFLCLM